MTEARRAANRATARRSTGPRSAAGKARSSQNAFRHGLSRPRAFVALAGEALAFAAAIAPPAFRHAPEVLDVVSARAYWLETQRVKAQILAAAAISADESSGGGGSVGADGTFHGVGLDGVSLDTLKALAQVAQYERRAHSRLRRAVANLDALLAPAIADPPHR